ncbi:MAG: ATP-binding protein [Rickettsiales bacterium]|nr:ATP-binding protein [Rickettsiales bacterium]
MANNTKGPGFPSLDQVANIILVASGKGGVGKSTVAVNLASALRRGGKKVGLLDADIYGPSIPTMLNLHKEVQSSDGKHIDPNEIRGLKVMSMGFLIPPSKAMIWRGPMLHSAVTQFLRDVHWGPLDYLVVDLPPGTGDVQLTFAQALTVTGAVIVSTPQEVALADVVRARAMFDSVKIPILGLVENMSYFICDGCDKKHHIFATGGARKAAEQFGIPFLAEIPLEPMVRRGGDNGMPIVEAEVDHPVSQAFVQAAQSIILAAAVATEERLAREAEEAEAVPGHRSLPIVT